MGLVGWGRCSARLDGGRGLAEQDLLVLVAHLLRPVDRVALGIGRDRGGLVVDGLEPAFQVLEIVEVLALPLIGHDPGIGRHIGDRIGARDIVATFELTIEHAIEPVRLVDVAVDRIGDLLRRVGREVVVLPRHGTEAAHLPEQPFDRLGTTARIARQEPAGLFGEIEQDGAGLEQRDRRAAVLRLVVDDGRHAVVRGDLEEVGLELLALADIDRVDRIGRVRLFEEQRDLVPVGRRPVIEVDHRERLF